MDSNTGYRQPKLGLLFATFALSTAVAGFAGYNTVSVENRNQQKPDSSVTTITVSPAMGFTALCGLICMGASGGAIRSGRKLAHAIREHEGPQIK